ncbi:cysteine hydrolase family protein [Mycolicibacter hiberniae]|uniref:Isochorismatase n=1 Tax=Mycolicibacter hiberniae TaxID=29314 RepID=A0A7I7WZL5_9MYCO|nr:isochorismatase family cysteine hydrolase [Mycolicibacter hiberniae]MCV7085502.1 cysteine hydrolase [Mycolicibacter hiberniae]ORV71287.1 isochorismatase [Mycolicibacter hiberniae]BBZ22510.1 isochorismatase [Mycolicibacter hiberniae]
MTDTAVVVVDMLNAYRHPDAEQLADNVAQIVEPLADLVECSRAANDVDLIYVNDNYGDFTAGFAQIAESALNGSRPELVRPVAPVAGDRLMTKVRHSAFYATPLEYLLGRLGTRRLILAGQVTEQCVLYTALDAYVRHLPVVIPVDAVAHIDAELGAAALEMMCRNMAAERSTAAECLR